MNGTESHTGIFVPDGYHEDGSNRPLIEIEIIEKKGFPDGETLISYLHLNDTRKTVRYCNENVLIYKEVSDDQ